MNQTQIATADSHNTINNNTNTITTNSHNTNTSFNLQFFLNETCKNALNLSEFIQNVKVDLKDIERIGDIGYVNGLSEVIIRNLNALGTEKRPIHCTDQKRETFYVKDENKWEKENDDKNKLRKAIKKIANKIKSILFLAKNKYLFCLIIFIFR